jgi:hypothetical protein
MKHRSAESFHTPTPFVDGKVATTSLPPTSESGTKPVFGLAFARTASTFIWTTRARRRQNRGQSAAAGKSHRRDGLRVDLADHQLTNACARLGAHAALVVTPFYYGGRMNEAAFLQHYTAVADRRYPHPDL